MSEESTSYLVRMLGGALLASVALGVALTWGIASLVRRDARLAWGAMGVAVLALTVWMWSRAIGIFLVHVALVGLGIGCLLQALRRPRPRGGTATIV